jgi:hypothetical protein
VPSLVQWMATLRCGLAAADDQSIAGSYTELGVAESTTIGLFDVIKPLADVVLWFALEGDIRGTIALDGLSDEALLKDEEGQMDLSLAIPVSLPGGREYT